MKSKKTFNYLCLMIAGMLLSKEDLAKIPKKDIKKLLTFKGE